jgi:hypothetical protein
MIIEKAKPATVASVSGLRDFVGSGGLNNPKHSDSNDDKQAFALAAIRSSCLRIKLIENELHSVGVALKSGFITPEDALDWAEEVAPGCVGYVPPAMARAKERAA